jgi:hypothetical protein
VICLERIDMGIQQIAIIVKDVDSLLISQMKASYPSCEIIVVTPNTKNLRHVGIKFYEDSLFLNREKIIRKIKHPSPIWIYQQLLKYQVVLMSNFENTLILDGDSLIKANKFLEKNHLFYTRKKIESKYNQFVISSFGLEYANTKNYITNQMNFNKNVLMEMIVYITRGLENWVDEMIEFINSNSHSEFSEYQLYAAWAQKNTATHESLIKIFRRMDLVNHTSKNALKKYDLIAYEKFHERGFARLARAHLYYLLNMGIG